MEKLKRNLEDSVMFKCFVRLNMVTCLFLQTRIVTEIHCFGYNLVNLMENVQHAVILKEKVGNYGDMSRNNAKKFSLLHTKYIFRS